MGDKVQFIYLLYFGMFLFDIINISDARKILLDFLIGRRNRKNAMKIHREQILWNRMTMDYIGPMLKKHRREFRIFHILYKTLIYSLAPRYLILVMVHIFAPSAIWYVFLCYFIIEICIAILYRIVLGPNRRSVYALK